MHTAGLAGSAECSSVQRTSMTPTLGVGVQGAGAARAPWQAAHWTTSEALSDKVPACVWQIPPAPVLSNTKEERDE